MSDTIGKFFRDPTAKPGKQTVPELSLPTRVPFEAPPVLGTPASIPFQPPPTLDTPTPTPNQSAVFQETTPAKVPFQVPPKLEVPTAPPVQPPPLLTTPDTIAKQPPPVLTPPTFPSTQPPPTLSVPAVIPVEPAPVLTSPAKIPFESAPPLETPPVIPFESAPPLDTPPVIPFEPAPPEVIPPAIPFESPPDLRVTGTIAFEPPPDLRVPAVIPFEPPPALTVPASIPLEPAPTYVSPRPIPFEPPPVLTAPAPVDPGPPSTPGPDYYSDSKIVNAVDGIGVNLPPPLGPVGSPVEVNIGFDRNSLKPRIHVDLHLKEIPGQIKANVISYAKALASAAAQYALSQATSYANQALDKAKNAAVNAVLDNIGIGGIPLRDVGNIWKSAPGGAQIPLPQADPGKIKAGQHKEPSVTVIENVPVSEADPDFTYAKDSRQRTQNKQVTAALQADSDNNNYNKWNDNFQAGEEIRTVQPVGLLVSNAPIGSGINPLPAIISSEAGFDAQGYFAFDGSEQSLPKDDEVYVPLVFTDLRPDYQSNFRAVYFRPFIKNLSENFAPQWNMANYFGRVDPVATYKNTDRTISLGFKITCFSPEDLAANYRKLAWLSSMCYPEYEGGAYFAGPVIRLRVGDVISAIGGITGKGLSGIITSLDINYDEATWELTANQKLPRDIDVSIGFHVLHDSAVGITKTNAGMQFGGYRNGTGNVRNFRAAFGSVDYLNEVAAAPGTGQVPNLMPSSANPLSTAGDFGALPTVPSLGDGTQPFSQNLPNAPSFPSSNSDSFLG